MSRFWFRFAWLLLAFGGMAQARADDMNCNGQPVTTHKFQSQPGDVLHPQHLEITRPYSGTGKLEVSVCNADLRIRPDSHAKELKLLVDMKSQTDGHPAEDYIHTLDVTPDHGRIHLKFTKAAHASVTLVVPMDAGSHNEFDLGRGQLVFDAAGTAGQREINVGMGDMKLIVDGDQDYSGMEVNIGMGSLHDHRPGGHDGHFVVSRNYSGTGNGPLEINVGMGSLDINQE
ncbi:MAG TPA: hypothetical protein VFA02_02475 [Pseudacidobacterium sp.]|nr:hypothetical protein [Pseudacidobacterium sp.]